MSGVRRARTHTLQEARPPSSKLRPKPPTEEGPALTTRQRRLYDAVTKAAPNHPDTQLMMVDTLALRTGASLTDMRVVREILEGVRPRPTGGR